MVAIYNTPTKTIAADDFLVTTVVPSTFPGVSTPIITSSDGVSWQIEYLTEIILLSEACAHGGKVYLVGVGFPSLAPVLVEIISVSPVVYSIIEIGEDFLPFSVEVDNLTNTMAILKRDSISLEYSCDVSYSLGKKWELIPAPLPVGDGGEFMVTTNLPIGHVIPISAGGFNVVFVEYEGLVGENMWSRLRVARLGKGSKKLVDLSTLMDQPYDFAQSAL